MDKTHWHCPCSSCLAESSQAVTTRTGENINWKLLTRPPYEMNNTGQEEIKASSSTQMGGLSRTGRYRVVHAWKPVHCDGEVFSWGEDGQWRYVCNDALSRPGPESHWLTSGRMHRCYFLDCGVWQVAEWIWGQELVREDEWSLGTKMLVNGRPTSKKQNFKVKNCSSKNTLGLRLNFNQ